MNYLITYTSFEINEAIVGKKGADFKQHSLFDKESKETQNVFSQIFRNDADSLKRFIENNLNFNQLELVGNGWMGLAFLWKDKNDKVIKFTADPSEYESAKKIAGKEIPGLAKYFWAKEVDIPRKYWLKNKWYIHSDEKLIKKAYIICLEKLTPLSDLQTDILCYIDIALRWKGIDYFNLSDTDKMNSDKIKDYFYWLKYEDEENFSGFKSSYTRNELVGLIYGSEKHRYKEILEDISVNQFVVLGLQLIAIHKSLKANGIPTYDLHTGNMGFNEKGKLVAFDCMGNGE